MALSLRGTIRICRGSEQLGCDGRGETPGPGSPGLVLWVSRTPGESALTSPPPALMDSLCAFVLEACLHVRLLCLGGGMGQVEEKGASSARPGLLLVCGRLSHTSRAWVRTAGSPRHTSARVYMHMSARTHNTALLSQFGGGHQSSRGLEIKPMAGGAAQLPPTLSHVALQRAGRPG